MSDVVFDAAFDANMYVSLVKSIVKYTNISDCWVCGKAGDFTSPLLGVLVSDWTELDPSGISGWSYLGTPTVVR